MVVPFNKFNAKFGLVFILALENTFCYNKKWESGKEINNNLYHLSRIFLFIKIKVSLNLHLLFISCEMSA